jgi:DNA-binding NarL/FixJ family response regulator
MSEAGKAPYRLFVVEDHEMMRYALVRMVGQEVGLMVCGQAASVEEALPKIRQAQPHLVLIDVTLPGIDGIGLVGCLLAEKKSLLCLMVSGHQEELYAKAAYRAGAKGYVRKDHTDDLLQAIYAVLNGELFFSEEIRRELGL